MRKFLSLLVAGVMMWTSLSCGRDAQPEPETTSDPTPTPIATPPDPPDLMDQDSEAGAEAFIAHYIDVLNYARATGVLEELRSLNDEACEGCAVLTRAIDRVYQEGGNFEDGDWVIDSTTVTVHAQATHVALRVTVRPGRLTKSSTAKTKDLSGFRMAVRFWITRHDTGWLAADVVAKEDA